MKHAKLSRRTTVKAQGKDYLTTREAGRLLGTGYRSVQEWFDKGLLVGIKSPGGHRRISRESVSAFMKQHHLPLSHGGRRSTRVLVIDDEPALLENISAGLESIGRFEVRGAEGWLKAGLLFGEFRPHCVVLDVMLDDVPGAKVVRDIRSSPFGRDTWIVAISGKTEDKDEREILSAGANIFIKKPFSIAELIRAVKKRNGRLG